jgi:hypothetical protein
MGRINACERLWASTCLHVNYRGAYQPCSATSSPFSRRGVDLQTACVRTRCPACLDSRRGGTFRTVAGRVTHRALVAVRTVRVPRLLLLLLLRLPPRRLRSRAETRRSGTAAGPDGASPAKREKKNIAAVRLLA